MTEERTVSRFAALGARSRMDFELQTARYNLLHAMRAGLAPYGRKLSLQEAADEMARLGFGRMSRERVRQVVDQGPPQEGGVPGARFANTPEELERRVRAWKAHGTKRGDARAEVYRRELEEPG